MSTTPIGHRTESAPAHRLDIQGLRALAVVAVLLFHAGLPVPGGFVGVDMFFVVSGFVISQVLLREKASHGRIRLGRFYVRRLQRLAPALALLCLATCLASVLLQSPFGAQQTTALTAAGAMTLVANVVIAVQSGDYFAAAAERNPLLHTWSLGVEEQFYSFFPLALMGMWLLTKRRRWGAGIGVGALSAASFALCLLVAAGLTGRFGAVWSGFYAMPPRIWEFGVGALLAIAAVRFPNAKLAQVGHVVGLGLLLASVLLITPELPFPGPAALLPVVGTALLLVPSSGEGTVVSRAFLSSPPLVRIGDWSYSLYLWHWPFVVFAKLLWPGNSVAIVAATLASFAPAVASFRWLEQPLRRRSLPTRRAVAGFVAATLIPPLVVVSGLWAGARAGWGVEWPTTEVRSVPATNLTTCLTEPAQPAGCVPPGLSPQRVVLLVGDSQAGALLPGVAEAAQRLGRPLLYSSVPGCPFVDADSSGDKAFDCRAWQHNTLKLVQTLRPGTLIIANRSVGYTQPSLKWRTLVDDAGRPATDQQHATERYGAALKRLLTAATGSATQVILVDNMVEPGEVDNEVSLLRRVLPPAFPKTFDGGRSLALRQPSVDVHARLRAEFPTVVQVDPASVQCHGSVCPLMADGLSLYSDPLHFSVAGARLLLPVWEELLSR